MLRLVAVLAVGAVGSASAELAATQPTEKLLVLPLAVSSAADSATSIAVTDAARERLNSLARYKVMLVSKSKMCEALAASGFPCDGLMDARQAEQLARFLSVNSWTMGTLSHNSSLLTAAIHVVSGGSGFASTFTVTGGPIGSPQPLSEAIAQKLNSIIRAAEYARSCNEQRGRSNFQKALDDARRGLAIEPNLAALQLCVASRSEEHTSELQSLAYLVCRLLLEKKKKKNKNKNKYYQVCRHMVEKINELHVSKKMRRALSK